MINPPLTINIHIIDNETDKEERVTTYSIRKISVDLRDYKSYKDAEAEYKKQSEGLERKYKAIMNTIIWAMNNSKTLEIVNSSDDG